MKCAHYVKCAHVDRITCVHACTVCVCVCALVCAHIYLCTNMCTCVGAIIQHSPCSVLRKASSGVAKQHSHRRSTASQCRLGEGYAHHFPTTSSPDLRKIRRQPKHARCLLAALSTTHLGGKEESEPHRTTEHLIDCKMFWCVVFIILCFWSC